MNFCNDLFNCPRTSRICNSHMQLIGRADPARRIETGVFQSASSLFENEGSKHELSKRLGSWNSLRVSPIDLWGGTWKSTNSGQTRILLAVLSVKP
jgi:hypothetical protein